MIKSKAQKKIYQILSDRGYVTLKTFKFFYSTEYKAKEQLRHFFDVGFLIIDKEKPSMWKWTGKTLKQYYEDIE